MLRRPDDPALARPIVDEQGSAVAADIPAGDAGIVAGPDLDGDHHTVVELEERFETVVALLIIDMVHLAEDRRDFVGSIHHHDLVEQMDAPVEHHAAAGHGILPPSPPGCPREPVTLDTISNTLPSSPAFTVSSTAV